MANAAQNTNPSAPTLALVKKDTVDVVAAKVREFQERGEIHFPPNYSPENAMKAAWLILQETVDRNKKPVLSVCTKDSIANALLNMVVQGLNPGKQQGYFIAYGATLLFQRSYFGTRTVALRVTGAVDIVCQVVYEGDEFEYAIDRRGVKQLIKHTQKLENIDETKIRAAYCTIVWEDREHMDLMTIDQIKRSWKQSQMNPIDDKGQIKAGSTHGKFVEEMAKKTVLNRTCKGYINSSDDASLLIHHFRETDRIASEAALEAEIIENANSEIIDLEPAELDVAEEPEGPSEGQAPPEPAPVAVKGPAY